MIPTKKAALICSAASALQGFEQIFSPRKGASFLFSIHHLTSLSLYFPNSIRACDITKSRNHLWAIKVRRLCRKVFRWLRWVYLWTHLFCKARDDLEN
ncbi:hypothetical protein SAMN04515695_6059 [Pseudovibrio sp. Tun.PSC04-5.I4]|nr:hypothetical protein SAMN04515695_6059 [Pseudovibrio sp. Tun.PSC04-5.I4]